MKNLLYNELKELQQILRVDNQLRNNKLAQKKYERQQKIQNGKKFELRLVFWNKRESGSFVEYIGLEGYKNGNMILEQYKNIGKEIGLKAVELYLKEENEIRVMRYFWETKF